MTVPDPDTGTPRVVPEVVRNYSISNADRTYTFELKRTFRFHTGARVTAWSFARAFNRDADPLLGSPAARLGFMREITGADAAMHGTAKAISGVQVLGPYRLRIRFRIREVRHRHGVRQRHLGAQPRRHGRQSQLA